MVETRGKFRYTRLSLGPKGGVVASDNKDIWGNVGIAGRYWFSRKRFAPALEFTSALVFKVAGINRAGNFDNVRGPMGFAPTSASASAASDRSSSAAVRQPAGPRGRPRRRARLGGRHVLPGLSRQHRLGGPGRHRRRYPRDHQPRGTLALSAAARPRAPRTASAAIARDLRDPVI
jgi:hypothetical protein